MNQHSMLEEFVIDDFSRTHPQAAIARRSEKGKWWLRPFRTATGQEGHMLCVEARDMEDPQSCIVPPLTLPLARSGWHQIWIGTYRPRLGGGVDVRLSNERCFEHVDPQQVRSLTPEEDHSGRLVEVLFREAAELTGQDLIVQQPYGTYQSLYWGDCTSHLAYVRLVKLTDEQVTEIEQQRVRRQIVYGYDDDGFSYCWQWGTPDLGCVDRILAPFTQSDASFINYCIGSTGCYHFEMPYADTAERFDPEHPATRLGDMRAQECWDALASRLGGFDRLIDRVIEKGHEAGIEVYLSQRMSQGVTAGPIHDSHPEWHLVRSSSPDLPLWDFARPDARQQIHDALCWIARRFDADGVTLDFSRLAAHFNVDEPDKFDHMNDLVSRLRASFDEINVEKCAQGKRPVKLIASWVENVAYLKTVWEHGHFFHEQGLDVRTWLREGWFDIVMPEGSGVERYVGIARDDSISRPAADRRPSRTKIYLRHCQGFAFNGVHSLDKPVDPVAEEDKQDVYRWGVLGPLDIETGILRWWDHNRPDGVMLFNYSTNWNSLSRMGDPDEIRRRVESGSVHGLVEREKIAFG